ncbi:hypothetical protein PHK61_25005 [Actinomycetospora lutea]|uniref:hypothetical protein n=1 Tax=Actinomycetospora lutea TaxID=663604 RepID=UPI0023651146|nr:hypothetical protein [Actinomycetospora lutea]MDD7941685.1 hypothetical protein [Actinomycetospora lutea]
MEALAAQHQLPSRLGGWQWQTVAAARSEGATWHDIAAATATTPDDAEFTHVAALERAEQAAAAAGVAFNDARYRAAEPDNERDDTTSHDHADVERGAAAAGETAMTEPTDPTDRPTATAAGADATGVAWATPDPTLPLAQLSERELIARAEYCDEVAHSGSPADQAGALRELDATWDEAERRAHGLPAVSVPAQVAGYIGLVREDYDHALAAETATWRRQLDAALQPLEIDPERDLDLGEVGSGGLIPTAHDLDAERAKADPALVDTGWAWGRYAGRELTLTERADRAQSIAQGAGVDVAGYDPDTDIYTDPATGQVVRLDRHQTDPGADSARGEHAADHEAVEENQADVGDWDTAAAIAERDGYVVFDPTVAGGFRPLAAAERATLAGQAPTDHALADQALPDHALSDQARAAGPERWTAAEHEAYLDARPGASTSYNPAAEYGDPDWREPASDDEATARTTWLGENTAPASGWRSRPLTAVEDALQDAQERAVLSDRAHDSDPYAWAEYHRLQALEKLAPIPERDALDELQRDEHGEPDTLAAPDWPRADDAAPDEPVDEVALDSRHYRRSTDFGQAPDSDDGDRLRARLEDVRARLTARDAFTGLAPGADLRSDAGINAGVDASVEEQRREQRARWHVDDRASAPAEAGGDGDGGENGSPGWFR